MSVVDKLRSIGSREESIEEEEEKLAREMQDAEDHTTAAARKITDAMNAMERKSEKEAFTNMAMALAHLHISEIELKEEAEEAAGVGNNAKEIINEEESVEDVVDRQAKEHGWNPQNLEQAAEDLRKGKSVPSPSTEQIEQVYRKYNS